MGYETKLVIGTKHEIGSGEDIWVDPIAELELCKCGYKSAIGNLDAHYNENNEPEDKFYYYGSDGNTRIYQDNCGDWFKPVQLDAVIDALEKDISEDEDPYRRFIWAYNLLSSIKKHAGEYDLERMVVLFYGH